MVSAYLGSVTYKKNCYLPMKGSIHVFLPLPGSQLTMQLLDLPTEILISIFNHVGPYNFSSDASRLTVCKHWVLLSQFVCFRHIQLSLLTSWGLLACPNLETILDSLQILDLDLTDYKDLTGINTRRLYRTEEKNSVSNKRNAKLSYDACVRINTLQQNHLKIDEGSAWTEAQRRHITQLATTVGKKTRNLHTLRIYTVPDWTEDYTPPTRTLIPHAMVFADFLSSSNLTVLDLDITVRQLHPWSRTNHLCPQIAALLTSLHHLRLRMPFLCAEALVPKPHGSGSSNDDAMMP